MRILLTGSTGFIGSHLLTFLQKRGDSVLCFGRDHTMKQMLDECATFKPEVIIHAATCFIAEHQSMDIEKLMQSNISFGSMVLESAIRSGCRKLINTGTVWQHYQGISHKPTNLYAATKNAFEEIIKYYVDADQLSAITLRICDSYGPNDRRGKIISHLIAAAKNNSQQAFALSPGEQLIDYVHVQDIVRGFEIALKKLITSPEATHEAYVLSSQKPVSLKKLVHMIEELSQKKLNVSLGAKPYRQREVMSPQCLDPVLPGWSSMIHLQQGIKELLYE